MFFDHNPYYVYIVECADQTLYTGITWNIRKRIKQHNGLTCGGSKYVRSRRPVSLVLVEKCTSHREACRREIEIKAMSRAEKKELISKTTKEDLLSSI